MAEQRMQPYPILQYFTSAHLPAHLREVAEPFETLAQTLAARPTAAPAEVAAALRKLLEAKDCAVRAALVVISVE